MKTLFYSLLISLGLIFLYSAHLHAAESDDQVSKKEQIWSSQPFYYWFQKTSDKDNFTYIINNIESDSEHIKLMKYQDWYHIRFDLQHANNSITIKNNDKLILEIEVYYIESWESELVPDEILKKPFHTEDQEKPCMPCHRLKPVGADYAQKEVNKQICYPCHHQNYDNLKSRHKPATNEWRCLQCHRAEAFESELAKKPLKFTIEEPDAVAPLCYKCHKKFSTHIKSQDFIHGPIGMQGCNMCHDTHGSQYRKNLIKEDVKLCVECHEMQDMMELPNIHPAITKKGCTICHDPHGSHYPLQLKDAINPLCYSCHPKIYRQKNNHPVQRHPVYAKKNPFDPEYEFNCISCHNPHSSNYEKLLPEEETMMLCAKCHSL